MEPKLSVNTRAVFDETIDPDLTQPIMVKLRLYSAGGEVIDVCISATDAIKLGHQIQVAAINGFVQFSDYKIYKEV